MAGAKSALVLLPRFTTFVGAGEWTTAPLDVSSFGSAQFELWRGPQLAESTAQFRAYLEESLDGVAWYPEDGKGHAYDPGASKSIVLSRAFAMKWFRLRVKVVCASRTAVTLWAEGILRS